MIKRTGALLLTMLYTVTVFGFVINSHYCGRLLMSVAVNAPSKSCIKAEKKMKCCNDKQLEVKIKDAHQSASFSFLAKTFVFDVAPIWLNEHFLPVQRPLTAKLLGRAPPDHFLHDVPVFIKNCTFRI